MPVEIAAANLRRSLSGKWLANQELLTIEFFLCFFSPPKVLNTDCILTFHTKRGYSFISLTSHTPNYTQSVL